MKKVLFASTALVAAGLMTASAASASEKIKLNLGGFSKWWVVGAWQEDDFQTAAGADYGNVDVKGDNEIFFGGSTTLDNGMKVGIQVELEAGGHTETGAGNANTGDVIDESYVFIETGFGKFIVGSENNGTYLLHVQAPDAAGNWGEGGVVTGGAAIVNPGVQSITPLNANAHTTAIVTDNDAEKITYVAPTFYGLTVGGSYVPSTSEDNRNATNLQGVNAADAFGVGALYANTFGGVGLKLSAGFVTYTVEAGTTGETETDEYAFGGQASYAGFTLGGSYRKVKADAGVDTSGLDIDGDAFDVGVQYASGPYAVSLAYFNSQVGGTVANPGEDEIDIYQLSGKYALGPGVDVLASVAHAEFDSEDDVTAGADNKGWTVMTGLGLSF